MIQKHYTIDNKFITVIDDLFSLSEKTRFYNFGLNSAYYLSRKSYEMPEFDGKYPPTLVSNYSPRDVFNPNFDFFSNSLILDYVKKNNLRLTKAYFNLSTPFDLYTYHVDVSVNTYAMTLLYYANMEWYPEWEGETHLSDDTMREIKHSISFVPGRLVMFDPSIPHKSSQPSILAKYYRFVFVARFMDRKEPGIDIQDIIYTKPEESTLTDKELNAIKWVYDHFSHLPHGNTTFAEHLFQTYCCMKNMGCSVDASLGGLFHSIYGTDFYDLGIKFERNNIRELIGYNAEELSYYFCEEDRDHKILNNTNNLSDEKVRNLLYILYANKISQINYVPSDYSEFSFIKDKIKK